MREFASLPKSLRVRPFTACGAFAFGLAFVILNLFVSVSWTSMAVNIQQQLYSHGWPFTYMRRDVSIGDMGGIKESPWPFRATRPAREFHPLWLAADALIGLVLTTLAAAYLHTLALERSIRVRFSLRTCLILVSIIGVAFGVWSVEIELAQLAHVTTKCLVILSIVCSFLYVVHLVARIRHRVDEQRQPS